MFFLLIEDKIELLLFQVYLYVPRLTWWQSHPFSIAWLSTEESAPMIEMTPMPLPLEKQNSVPTTSIAKAVSHSQSQASANRNHHAPNGPYDPSIYCSGINAVQVPLATIAPDGTGMRQTTNSNPENYLQDRDPHRPLRENSGCPMVRNSSSLPVKYQELVASATPIKPMMHFIISKQSGFTKALYNLVQSAAARADPEKPEKGYVLKLLGLVEGPYGGHHSFDSFGTVVLVAGGVGITHCLGYIRHLLHGCNEGTVATQKVKLVWVIRKSEHIHWVSAWLEEILGMPLCYQVLEIDIYITQPRGTTGGNGCASLSGLVKVFIGRPQFEAVLEKVVRCRIGAMAVTVCGGGAMSDSVRAATLKFMDQATIDYSEESFTW